MAASTDETPVNWTITNNEHTARLLVRFTGVRVCDGANAGNDGDVQRIRAIIGRLRQTLGDDAENPTYIFTELRVGYRMLKGETLGLEQS